LRTLPTLPEFLKLSRPGVSVPIRLEVDADTETPVSAFLKLSRGQERAFLFESVEGGERTGRWSFLGAGPRDTFTWRLKDPVDPLEYIQKQLDRYRSIKVPGAPRFTGGLVGHFSYDAVQLFEPRVPIAKEDEVGYPDAVWMDFDEIIAFDNLRHSMHFIVEARCDEGDNLERVYADAVARIQKLRRVLAQPLNDVRPLPTLNATGLSPRVTQKQFEAAVVRAKEYIRAGDCQQIVLSQRFEAEVGVGPFEIYRALRRVNPSPYLFFVQDGSRAIVGSSPETLVRVDDGEIILRPIAGTRRRGQTPQEDARLEQDLRDDPKENAEHIMLVDLGRNDVGRVSEIGSVKVEILKSVERYSHVLHLVSQVRGKLKKSLTALDVLRATFPAGTVSGAPKVRAMQIIDELEPARRGPYAGAVGYFDRSGNMDMAIAIRTLFQDGRRVTVQSGAGIVFDSKPAAEYQETVNKAKALFAAVAHAQSRPLEAEKLDGGG